MRAAWSKEEQRRVGRAAKGRRDHERTDESGKKY